MNTSPENMGANFLGRFLLFVFSIFLASNLVACDSGLSGQVEKCVQAGIAASGPYKDSAEKANAEVTARVFCLRAASGKE